MKPIDFKERAAVYSSYLLDQVMPFWMEHSMDRKHGGYFSCLDRQGRVYDRDKFLWLQCRQVWTLAMLYNEEAPREEWLNSAIAGAEFLEKHGRNSAGDWYFSLDEAGRPLVEAYNIFSDCFATMGFAQLFRATGDQKHSKIATDSFSNILKRKDNPKGRFSKLIPGTRDLKNFSLPMILCNLVLEIEHLLDPALVQETLEMGVEEVMQVFYKSEYGLILEHVGADGKFVDSFDGRLINPGHGLEAMWFIMDIGKKWNNPALIQQCVDISLQLLDYGWDTEYGGILYFKDLKGAPLQQLEWDQKLWWVQLEALINVLKGYQLTGNTACLAWYEKLHDYTWQHFTDYQYGEMFGYLNRQGEVLLDLKGGKWKGCFHVPRALYQLKELSTTLAQEKISTTSNLADNDFS